MLIDQGRGVSPTTGRTYMVANDSIRGNHVIGDQGVGALQDYGDNAIFTRNNVFDDNTYALDTPGGDLYQWNNTSVVFSDWQAAGQDAHATLTPL